MQSKAETIGGLPVRAPRLTGFDWRGYIVVRNAITTAQIDDLSKPLEAHRTDEKDALFFE